MTTVSLHPSLPPSWMLLIRNQQNISNRRARKKVTLMNESYYCLVKRGNWWDNLLFCVPSHVHIANPGELHHKFSSASYRRRRCQPVAAAFGPHQAAGWGPPSSQSPGWFPPADTGWPGCPSSWGNSHRSVRRRWPLEILCLCWLHLNYVSGWMSYPWHLDSRTGVSTKMREWGNDLCEMNGVRRLQRSSEEELEMLLA